MPSPTLSPCTPADIPALVAISRQSFYEAFAPTNHAHDLHLYMDQAYHPDRLRAELDTPGTSFYLLYAGEVLAGYLKLNTGTAQVEFQDQNGLEIERIYLLQSHTRQGLGAYMLRFALEQARSQGRDFVWLGVWEHNGPALAFYARHGFRQIGAHGFLLGTDAQTDLLMRLDLT
ncbi:MAG: GNAT family N-acetyltransferase [Bacteroidia bacterium]|nr:GNAT family N-acetyltransferase [Bacteroidia bacterium]